MTLKRMIEAACNAIDNIFSDTNVDMLTTLEALEEVESNLEMKIKCLREDIRRKAKTDLG